MIMFSIYAIYKYILYAYLVMARLVYALRTWGAMKLHTHLAHRRRGAARRVYTIVYSIDVLGIINFSRALSLNRRVHCRSADAARTCYISVYGNNVHARINFITI